MTRRGFVVGRGELLALALLALCGCSAQQPSPGAPHEPAATTAVAEDGPRCWDPAEDRRESITSPRDARERLINAAIELELDELQLAIGRYARGERPYYVGTLAIREERSGAAATSLADGPVWGILLRETAYTTVPARDPVELVIVSEGQERKLTLIQSRADASRSHVSKVIPFTTNAGWWASCRDCLPRFEDGPARIDLGDLRLSVDADGARAEHEQGVRVRLRGELKQVPPGELRLEQIARAHHFDHDVPDDLLARLVTGEGELTMDRTNTAGDAADDLRPRAPWPMSNCHRSASYSARWWVDPSCLGRYGVRDVVVGPIRAECCEPQPGPPRDQPPSCVELP